MVIRNRYNSPLEPLQRESNYISPFDTRPLDNPFPAVRARQNVNDPNEQQSYTQWLLQQAMGMINQSLANPQVQGNSASGYSSGAGQTAFGQQAFQQLDPTMMAALLEELSESLGAESQIQEPASYALQQTRTGFGGYPTLELRANPASQAALVEVDDEEHDQGASPSLLAQAEEPAYDEVRDGAPNPVTTRLLANRPNAWAYLQDLMKAAAGMPVVAV